MKINKKVGLLLALVLLGGGAVGSIALQSHAQNALGSAPSTSTSEVATQNDPADAGSATTGEHESGDSANDADGGALEDAD